MAYVETLYGHQDVIHDLDSLDKERAVSCGGRDRSIRLWKIVEESQLIFQGVPTLESMDCISMITESFFVGGCQSGAITLWDVQKKKAVNTVDIAHGAGNSITAISALRFGDVFASGSNDGTVRVWKCLPKKRHISPIMQVEIKGFINGLMFNSTGSLLTAAVSQEARLGRWQRLRGAPNACVVIKLLED